MKAVLFDLDGTLLPLDQDVFTKSYLKLLAERMAHLVEAKRFINQLLSSTAAMVADVHPEFTNKQVLVPHLCSSLEIDETKLMPVFDDFYANYFGKLKVVASPNISARNAVLAVLDQGLKAIVATNPIFPIAAIQQRMEWAGIADLPFTMVTSYETSHYCKPQIAYYQEVLTSIQCAPAECLMVGNDVEEDLIAAKLGMKTYWVTDWIINRNRIQPTPDYRGSLDELAEFLIGSNLSNL